MYEPKDFDLLDFFANKLYVSDCQHKNRLPVHWYLTSNEIRFEYREAATSTFREWKYDQIEGMDNFNKLLPANL